MDGMRCGTDKYKRTKNCVITNIREKEEEDLFIITYSIPYRVHTHSHV